MNNQNYLTQVSHPIIDTDTIWKGAYSASIIDNMLVQHHKLSNSSCNSIKGCLSIDQ